MERIGPGKEVIKVIQPCLFWFLRFPADINECEDISDKVPLCQNGTCTNTEGSYKCTCLPGFVASAKPHKCIPAIPVSKLVKMGN